MVEQALVLLLVLGLGAGNVARRDATTTRPSPVQTSFNISELHCFAQEQVLHPDGNCYTLLLKGPCERGHWLVFDKDEVFVPNGRNRRQLTCRPKPCSQPLRVFWPQDGQCHHKTRDKARLCPFPGNELRSDSFGEGECACEKTYIRFKPEVVKGGKIIWDGACYPLYQRGPCPARKILEAENLEGFGPVGVCTDDRCHVENNLAPGTWYARNAPDGRCHKLGEQGVCAEGTKFNVNPLTNLPECRSNTVSTNSLFNNTERCDGNLNKLTGDCRDILVLKAEKFEEKINRPRPRARPRRSASY